jgi:hypothetical protein
MRSGDSTWTHRALGLGHRIDLKDDGVAVVIAGDSQEGGRSLGR